ncbi:hypothetical protein [Ktedonosporobacter rubrisoli]|uniref:hypothetical protein n=1 Tax=Ktedonosporobacter rubrisoli TaxID=2509675 RepID=UPI0013EE6DF9|nr:hypothetical protein [Ktedonosporobacter rubrisoli]
MKLAVVLSDILGKSGRSILEALGAGESDPAQLASKGALNVRASPEQLIAALTADWREHHRFLLRELLSLIDAQDRSMSHLEQEIERRLAPFEEQIERCEKTHGSESRRNPCADG